MQKAEIERHGLIFFAIEIMLNLQIRCMVNLQLVLQVTNAKYSPHTNGVLSLCAGGMY